MPEYCAAVEISKRYNPPDIRANSGKLSNQGPEGTRTHDVPYHPENNAFIVQIILMLSRNHFLTLFMETALPQTVRATRRKVLYGVLSFKGWSGFRSATGQPGLPPVRCGADRMPNFAIIVQRWYSLTSLESASTLL